MPRQCVSFEISDTAAAWDSWVDLDGGDAQTALNAFINWLQGVKSGRYDADFVFDSGGTQAQATLTVSSTGSANDETCVIAGVTFTAKTSGATGNQFNISTTPATQASNMNTAFNASSSLTGLVISTVSGAVVTLKTVIPGIIGDTLTITEALANVALSDFATESTGVNGTWNRINMA